MLSHLTRRERLILALLCGLLLTGAVVRDIGKLCPLVRRPIERAAGATGER